MAPKAKPAVKKAGKKSGGKWSRGSPKRATTRAASKVTAKPRVSRRAALALGAAAIVAPMAALAQAQGGVHLASDNNHQHWDLLVNHFEKNNPPKGWFLDWLATLVQRPHIPLDAIMLVGDRESGKSTLYEAASLLLPEGSVVRGLVPNTVTSGKTRDDWLARMPAAAYLLQVCDGYLAGLPNPTKGHRMDFLSSWRMKDGRYMKFVYTTENLRAATPPDAMRIELARLGASIPKETLLPALYNERLAFHETLAHRLHRAA